MTTYVPPKREPATRSNLTGLDYAATGFWAGDTFYGATQQEAEQRRDAADNAAVDAARRAVLSSQAAIDAGLAAGESFAYTTRSTSGPPMIHDVTCHVVRPFLDRAAVWDEYAELQLYGDNYLQFLPATPVLLTADEIHAINRTYRRCRKCSPDVYESPQRRSQYGSEESRQVKGVSLRDRHIGMNLTLPDGMPAGRIEHVQIAVTTDNGIHFLLLEDVVTLTKSTRAGLGLATETATGTDETVIMG